MSFHASSGAQQGFSLGQAGGGGGAGKLGQNGMCKREIGKKGKW